MASLFYRKDCKCWYIRIKVNGKWKKLRGHPNKQTALKLLAKAVLRHDEPQYRQADENLTLYQFAENEYLPWAKAGHKAKRTVVREELAIRTWVETVGDTKLVDINRRIAERFRTNRLGTVSARTVNHDVGVISFVLNKAVEWELLKVNPLVGLKRLPENKKTPRWLTSEEITALMDVAHDELRAVLLVLLNTGLRRGELSRLEWSDVDLNQRVLHVRHKDEGHTKSRRERVVDLNDIAVEAFRHHKLDMKRRFGTVPRKVFLSQRGLPLGNSLLNQVKRVYARAGIEGAVVHSLRHTFGSQAVMSGVPLTTVKEWMGHSDISTTMVYVHVDRTHRREAINRFNLGGTERHGKVVNLNTKVG